MKLIEQNPFRIIGLLVNAKRGNLFDKRVCKIVTRYTSGELKIKVFCDIV